MLMKATRIMKRFCKARNRDVILLEEKIEKASIPYDRQWKVLLCREADEDCRQFVCEHLT